MTRAPGGFWSSRTMAASSSGSRSRSNRRSRPSARPCSAAPRSAGRCSSSVWSAPGCSPTGSPGRCGVWPTAPRRWAGASSASRCRSPPPARWANSSARSTPCRRVSPSSRPSAIGGGSGSTSPSSAISRADSPTPCVILSTHSVWRLKNWRRARSPGTISS